MGPWVCHLYCLWFVVGKMYSTDSIRRKWCWVAQMKVISITSHHCWVSIQTSSQSVGDRLSYVADYPMTWPSISWLKIFTKLWLRSHFGGWKNISSNPIDLDFSENMIPPNGRVSPQVSGMNMHCLGYTKHHINIYTLTLPPKVGIFSIPSFLLGDGGLRYIYIISIYHVPMRWWILIWIYTSTILN